MDPAVHIKTIAAKLHLHDWQVENTLRLLDDGATIPFISRYRKEVTGSLNEVQLAEIRDEYERLKELEKRREAVIKSVGEQDKMTPELLAKINAALTMSQLEDLYLPYRPKRKTRASVAREKGLEPLAHWLLAQKPGDPETEAEKYLADMVGSTGEALAGARDIIAEMVSEDELVRGAMRRLYERDAVITSKVVKGKESSKESTCVPATTLHGRSVRQPPTAGAACWHPPWRRSSERAPRRKPMRRQYASSLRTCASCSSPHRWERRAFWQ